MRDDPSGERREEIRGQDISLHRKSRRRRQFEQPRAVLTAEDLEVRSKNKELHSENMSLQKKLEETEENLHCIIQQTQRDQERYCHELEALRAELMEKHIELKNGSRKRDQIEEILQVRTNELREAQACIGGTEAVAYAEVQRTVEKLNSEIFQISAQITDAFPFEERRVARDSTLQTESARFFSSAGPALAKTIVAYPHHDDPILVQLALQACFVHFVSDIVGMWDPCLSEEGGNILDRLYNQIWDGEPQGVSARWRAVTKRYLRKTSEGYSGSLEAIFQGWPIRALTAILVFSGVPIPSRDIEQRVMSTFGEKVLDIARLVVSLRSAVGEEITSCEFGLICPAGDASFRGTQMEDSDAPRELEGQKSPEGHPILCAIELGLSRRMKKPSQSGAAGARELDESILMKAKVVLPSVLNDWLHEHEELSKKRTRE